MSAPTHAACGVWMRVRKNGVRIVETLDDGTTPYRTYEADLWECPKCGVQIVTGCGKPIARHEPAFRPDGADFTINGRSMVLPEQS